ncbi:ammonium transporter [Tautonia sociabilis]|uniref:Ammonium transporter n=1 Tax=Tautonia sociabilis TaxID=2080755 RepID=A0A432MJM5_9BACT|nr:ammonium transporter [Tautonia sociabilis]RUL87449.1 ammonium transporter [Tautonia sociabilis]
MQRRRTRTLLVALGATIGLGLALAPPAMAQEEDLASVVAGQQVALDTLWVMLAAFLVFFMQAGFAYVEGGLTRSKNTNNIMMKNLGDFALATLGFWIFGFAIMFGDGTPLFGTKGWLLLGADNSPAIDDYEGVYSSISWSGVPLAAKFMFQLVFAGTAATIVSGAMAERTKFHSYMIYSFFISAFIYPIVGHWIWGGGWLASLGMWDFAGSTVVHSTGAWLALMGALFIGPRIGKYTKEGKVNPIPGHSIPMAALGVFILWLGWFGFNPGSTMAATPDIAHIALTTNLAAVAGAVGAMVLSWQLFKKADISMTLNGVLAGLVAITAPCAFVAPWAAVVIGLAAGLLVVVSILFFDKVRVDDPVGAISVHGVCGALGTIAVGLFAQDKYAPGTTGDGLLFGGGASLLIHQIIGVVAVFGFCVVTGAILFGGIKLIFGLRVSAEEEVNGLDIGEHGMEAYPDFAPTVKASVPYEDYPMAARKASLKSEPPASAPRPVEVSAQ